MAQPPCAYSVYRSYQAYLESYISTRLVDIVPKLHEQGILTEEQKEAALNESQDLNSRADQLKGIVSAKIKESDDNFHDILEAYSLIGVKVQEIVEQFEQDRQKSISRRNSLDSQSSRSTLSSISQQLSTSESSLSLDHSNTSSDINMAQSMDHPKKVIRKRNALSDSDVTMKPSPYSSSRPSSSSGDRRAGARLSTRSTSMGRVDSSTVMKKQSFGGVQPLPPIPGSPLLAFNRRESEDHPQTLELVSSPSELPVPCEDSPEHTEISTESSEQWTVAAQETIVTYTDYPRPHRQLTTSDLILHTELQYIDELDKVVQETITNVAAQSIQMLTDAMKENVRQVQNRYRDLAKHYQEQYELLKKENEHLKTEHRLESERSSSKNQDLQLLLRQQQKHSRQREEQLDEEREESAALAEKLQEKEEEVEELSKKLEEAKAELNEIKRRLSTLKFKEQQGVANKLQVMSDIETLVSQIDSPDSEQKTLVEKLTTISRKLTQLRDRPATTGAFKRMNV